MFLLQQSLAGNRDAAADMCQRMLSQGLFKSIYHRDAFLPDGEVYRFSSSFPDGSKHKARCAFKWANEVLYCCACRMLADAHSKQQAYESDWSTSAFHAAMQW